MAWERVWERLAKVFPNQHRYRMDLTSLTRVRGLCRSGAARAIRQSAGLSLSEVAEAVGVQPTTIQRWEVGQRSPRGEAAIRYLEQLDILAGTVAA